MNDDGLVVCFNNSFLTVGWKLHSQICWETDWHCYTNLTTYNFAVTFAVILHAHLETNSEQPMSLT